MGRHPQNLVKNFQEIILNKFPKNSKSQMKKALNLR